MHRFARVAITTALVALTTAAHGATRGTPAEARAMLQKAIDHFKSAGRRQALADFTAGRAPFRDRDLYVVCVAADRKILASGGFPQYVGMSADMMRDARGNPIGKALWEAAAKDPAGSIQYPMINPMTHQTELKTTFYAKVADDVLCCVGAYGTP